MIKRLIATVVLPLLPALLPLRSASAGEDQGRTGGGPVVSFLVSPDGRQLGFGVQAAGETGGVVTRLMTCGTDGTGLRVVKELDQPFEDVLWFGNDRLIATAMRSTSYKVVPLDGSAASDMDLPEGCDVLYKRISPDGKSVAYTGKLVTRDWGRLVGLFVVELESGKASRLLETAVKTAPAWSPDSKRVAVADAGGYGNRYPLVVIDAASKEVLRAGVDGVGASWSADGRHLAFTTQVVAGGSWTYGVPSDGRIGVLDVEARSFFNATPPGRNDRGAGNRETDGFRFPLWSPAGDMRLVCTRSRTRQAADSEGSDSEELWITDMKIENTRKIHDTAPPAAWSSDGRSLFLLLEESVVALDPDSMKARTVASWKAAGKGGEDGEEPPQEGK